VWSYTFTPPYVFMARYLVKHRATARFTNLCSLRCVSLKHLGRKLQTVGSSRHINEGLDTAMCQALPLHERHENEVPSSDAIQRYADIPENVRFCWLSVNISYESS
jgi:hypothetical protein